MRTPILGQKWLAVAVGWLMILASYFVWTYLSYDVLFDFEKDWFYRVNALLHEHPEPGAVSDPLFWLASTVGNLLIFGLPCATIVYFFLDKFGLRIVGLTVGIALVLSLASKALIWVSPTTSGIKIAAVGDFLIGTAIVALCLLIARRRMRVSLADRG